MDDSPQGPDFDPDLILSILDRHKVEYVLVGGMAARAHGATRATADIDCVPNTANSCNRRQSDKAVAEALAQNGKLKARRLSAV